MTPDQHANRRDRVAIQVLEKWTHGGTRLPQGMTEDDAMLTVAAAADAMFSPATNDLDWERATLAHLGAVR
jgi:hypothetical protein